jgi:hypothetical protein
MPVHGAGAGTTCVPVPSSEADLAEGAFSPRAGRTADLADGASSPEGASAVPPWRAAGATRVVIVSCACFRFMS